ncbi:hypothetical protein [Streptomyces sp. ODS28]|uniref:hypothetical protein n=1 Tax=Streptomyces sp. ODS28 TaxID=3136688 RepID=UPI0031E70068
MVLDDSPRGFDVPPEQALLVLDMQDYSKIPEAKMAPARSDVDDILECVLSHAGLGLPEESEGAYKDTGDGAILVFAPHVLPRLVDPVLAELNAALRRYERQRLVGAPTIRLRASVHVGPLTLPDRRGDAINDACRLISSRTVYQGLWAAGVNGAFLAAVLSETAYRRTVAAGRTPELGTHHFLATRARVEGKPDFAEPCWLHVPGLLAAGLRSFLPEESEADEPSPAQKEPPGAGGGGSGGGVQQKAKASGKGQVLQVGGNYTTGEGKR